MSDAVVVVPEAEAGDKNAAGPVKVEAGAGEIDINQQLGAIKPATLVHLVDELRPIIAARNGNNTQQASTAGSVVDANASNADSVSAPPAQSASEDNATAVKEMYDIDGNKGVDPVKNTYKDLEAVDADRVKKGLEPLPKSGGRRRTKHKKHHKKGGKKSHKKGKSSKKVAKRRKSRKTGGRRSRKQNKH